MNLKLKTCWLSGAALVLQTISFSAFSAPAAVETAPIASTDWLLHSIRIPFSPTLTSDGTALAFLTRKADTARDTYVNELWVMASGEQKPVPVSGSVRQPKWSPRSNSLAFTEQDSEGGSTLRLYESGEFRDLLRADRPIGSFEWAPSGKQIGYLVSAKCANEPPFPGAGAKPVGVSIDKWSFSIYDALHGRLNTREALQIPMQELWVVDVAGGARRQLAAGYSPDELAWSPDGTKIAFVAPDDAADRASSLPFPLSPPVNSLYVVELATGRTTQVAAAQSSPERPTSIERPLWSDDGRAIAFLEGRAVWRMLLTHGPSAQRRLVIVELDSGKRTELENLPGLYQPKLVEWRSGELLIETTVNAVRGLYSVSTSDPARQPRKILSQRGMVSAAVVSRDGRAVAIVQQSTSSAPEVMVINRRSGSVRLRTQLNAGLEARKLPEAEVVTWRSKDGTKVSGLLYKPRDGINNNTPLVVLIHGGPTAPLGETFVPYAGVPSSSSHGSSPWPFPTWEVAEDGAAVLLPNYRGTASFAPGFDSPNDQLREPIEDIESGIDWAVDALGVNPSRVVVWGHSHGCSLGAFVLTRHRQLAAAVLAECAPGILSSYNLLSGEHNLLRQESWMGGPPQTNILKHIGDTPAYWTAGLTTPTMIQVGETASFVFAIDLLTGLWRAGVPHDFIVYEGEDHNLVRPSSETDAMASARDWFRYWVLGHREDIADRYLARWDVRKSEMQWIRQHYPLKPAPCAFESLGEVTSCRRSAEAP